jgi:hypothetical protein
MAHALRRRALAVAAAAAAAATSVAATAHPAAPAPPAPAPSPRAILYVEGMFDNSYDNATMLGDAAEVAASGFQVATLAFLHYHPLSAGGACKWGAVYNGVCFADAALLPQVLAVLRGPGSSIKQVLVSIGGAGCQGDFDYVAAHFDEFAADMAGLFDAYGFDGLDLDLEADLGPYMGVLNDMITLAAGRNWTLSACPVRGGGATQDAWVALVKNTSTARHDGSPGVSFLALQTYGGNEAPEVAAYVAALAGSVPSPATMVYPGGEAASGWGPWMPFFMVTNAQKAVPGMNGGMLWDYRLVKLGACPGHTNITEWGASFASALNGTNTTSAVAPPPLPVEEAALSPAAAAAQAAARAAAREARNRAYCEAAHHGGGGGSRRALRARGGA